jgi:hypothetical protein
MSTVAPFAIQLPPHAPVTGRRSCGRGVDDVAVARLPLPLLTTVARDDHLLAQNLADVVVQSREGRPAHTGERGPTGPPAPTRALVTPAAEVVRLVRRQST